MDTLIKDISLEISLELSRTIRAAIAAKGWSERGLARAIGMSESVAHRKIADKPASALPENGNRFDFSIIEIDVLARILDVPHAELLPERFRGCCCGGHYSHND